MNFGLRLIIDRPYGNSEPAVAGDSDSSPHPSRCEVFGQAGPFGAGGAVPTRPRLSQACAAAAGVRAAGARAGHAKAAISGAYAVVSAAGATGSQTTEETFLATRACAAVAAPAAGATGRGRITSHSACRGSAA